MRRLFPIVFSLISLCGFAQTSDDTIKPSNINIASPNAAALGKVADIPVSYQTGMPNVSIPIYTVQEGPLQLPISLSYHASGLKTMEQSSWVGAGWSLSAGGMITRQVRGGMADEVLSLFTKQDGTKISYLNNHGYYDYLFSESTGAYNPAILNPNVGLDWYNFATGNKDGEADIFTFNFNGYSGKFYFRPDNSVVLVPQQDIQFKPLFCLPGNSACVQSIESIYGWIVTTPDGDNYYFGKTLSPTTDVDAVENTQSYSPTSGPTFMQNISSWYLYKIQSPDSKYSITLTYAKENFSSYSMSLFNTFMAGGASGYSLVKNFVYGVRLKSISFSNGSVLFNTVQTPRQDLSAVSPVTLTDTDMTYGGVDSTDYNAKYLDNIQILGKGTSSFSQTFAFSYGYFYDNSHPLKGQFTSLESTWNIHSDKKRLKLQSLTEKSGDGSIIKPPHTFSYFDESSVPRTLTFAQDHWGYYNGATSNSSLIPALSVDGGYTNVNPVAYNANRDASWPAMQAGTLQTIQYPTGGSTRFVFHNHEVYVQFTQIDSTLIGTESAVNTAQSPIIPFSISSTTVFKSRVVYTNGGSGSVSVGPNASGLNIFSLSAGSYNLYVQSTSGYMDRQIACTLYSLSTHTGYAVRPVGGLRIDSLIYDNGIDANKVVQTFSYVDANGTRQGVLYSRPNYVALLRNDLMTKSGGVPSGTSHTNYFDTDGCVSYDQNNKVYAISPASVHPMRTVQGNHFGYNQVTVTQADGGYTIYKYPLHSNPNSDVCGRVINAPTCDPAAPNWPPAPLPFDFGRDELINKSVYNAAGVKLHETKYTNTYTTEQVGVTGLTVKTYGSEAIATEYEAKTAKKTQVTEENIDYNTSGSAPVYKKTDTYFESLFHTRPTRVVVSDSIGRKILTQINKTYTPDIVNPLSYTGDTYTSTLTTNMGVRLGNYNTAVLSCPNAPNPADCKFSNWLQYTYDINQYRKTYVASKITSDNNFKNSITGSTVWNAASADLKALIKLRNRNQVLPIEASTWRDGQFMESAFLTYMDFAGDSIGIYPSKYESIKSAVPRPSSYFAPVSANSSGVTKDSKYSSSLEESYKYNSSNGRQTEITGRSGITSAYLWDYANAEPIAVAVNATNADIAYTGFESDGSGNWAISSSLRQSLTPFFGAKYYDVHQGNISKTVSSSQSYVVSFWSTGSNVTVNSAAPTAVSTKNGWTNYQITISKVTLVTISAGVTANIDELRLYPSNSQMTTYSYDPLTGITLQADPNGQVMRYNYDALGRLIYITDQDSKILKKYTYNYYSQTNNN